jgi:hypothetical protein
VKDPCREFRIRMVALADGATQRDSALDAHLAQCVECRARLERTEQIIGALRDLERMTPALDMDGLTVAATQAGRRQERAVRAVRLLERMHVPEELERKLVEGPEKAPGALERLVDHDLQDPTQAVARRFAGRLERLAAPRALEGRLARSVLVRHDRDARRVRALVLAAAFVLVVSALGWILVQKRPVTEHGPAIVVQHVASPNDLDKSARDVFAQFSLGFLEVEKR